MCTRIPARDYSILTPRQLATVRKIALGRADNEEEELKRQRELAHQKTKELVSNWNNTIASSRRDRLARLQKEKEREEERKREIDEQDAKYRKLQKEAQLAAAKKLAFQNSPEVRAVNSQLLLAECLEERHEQRLLKEKKKIMEMHRQTKEDMEAQKRYEQMIENEQRIRAERKRKAQLNAQSIIQQREDRIRRKEIEREENLEDDRILRIENERIAREEKLKEEEAKKKQRLIAEEWKNQNGALQEIKKRKKLIELEEDKKILAEAERRMDEEDRRKKEEEEKRLQATRERQKLIDMEAERQMKIKKKQNDFLDKQIDEQLKKEEASIRSITEKREKLAAERRKEMLDAVRIQNQKRERKAEKKKIYPDFDEAEEQLIIKRIEQKRNRGIEVAEFQKKQAAEKREREAALREREKLEYNEEIRKVEVDMEIARQYAKKLIEKEKEINPDDE